MRKSYDLSRGKKNPYARKLGQSFELVVDADVAAYFEASAAELGVPVETLMRLYLAECASSRKRLRVTWTARPSRRAA